MTTGVGLALLGLFLAAGLALFGWYVTEAARMFSDAVWEASERLCVEMRFRTQAGAGLLPQEDPPERDTPEDLARFRAWLESQDMSEEEKGDLDGRFQCVAGLRSCPRATLVEYRKSLEYLGAPMPGTGA